MPSGVVVNVQCRTLTILSTLTNIRSIHDFTAIVEDIYNFAVTARDVNNFTMTTENQHAVTSEYVHEICE